MKIYLLRTNGNNVVVITNGETAKIFDSATTGKFEGIDLYAPDAELKLRERYDAATRLGTIENDYRFINGGYEIPASEIAPDLAKLHPVYDTAA